MYVYKQYQTPAQIQFPFLSRILVAESITSEPVFAQQELFCVSLVYPHVVFRTEVLASPQMDDGFINSLTKHPSSSAGVGSDVGPPSNSVLAHTACFI